MPWFRDLAARGWRLLRAIEFRDVLFLGGLALAWSGGSQISRPWTLVALGVAMVALSLPRRRA